MYDKQKLLKQVKQLGVLDADAIEIVEIIELRKNKKREDYRVSIKSLVDNVLGKQTNALLTKYD